MESKLVTSSLQGGGQLPLLVEPAPGSDRSIFSHREEIQALVDAHLQRIGGLLFRGFEVGGTSRFEQFVNWFRGDLLTYDYGSTPRSKIAGKIYTSTEYPASQTIPLHNEMSYTREWPLKIWFYSALVAEEGGETPIADSREIYRRIRPEIRNKFAERGLMYVRNYRVGMDLPWQQVFNTEDKSQVEEFCRRGEIDFEWKNGDELATRQTCQAVAAHPQSGEPLWFNQAHLFHISNLEPRFRKALLTIYKQDELPRNVLYGDGSPIAEEDLDEIRAVMDEVKVTFAWQPEDIMMLDNMLTAHSRNPYQGERKVAVAMAEACSLATCPKLPKATLETA